MIGRTWESGAITSTDRGSSGGMMAIPTRAEGRFWMSFGTPGCGAFRPYTSSLVQAALALDDFTTASMKAMPRTPSSIFG